MTRRDPPRPESARSDRPPPAPTQASPPRPALSAAQVLSWRTQSRETLIQMWGHGVDILEYQDAALIRDRAALAGPHVLRRTLAFVTLAALLGSIWALAAGVLTGSAFEAWSRSVLNFFVTFGVTTGGAFVVGRLLGGRAGFRQFVYVSALFEVPLQVVEAVLTVACSLVPVVGFYLLFALALLAGGVRLYFANLVTQATMTFPQPWQRWTMLLLLLLLAFVKGSLSLLG